MQASFKLLLTLALTSVPTLAWSQENKDAEPPAATKKADEAKPDEKKPDATTEDSAAQPQGPAAKKFVATYEQWKEILKQLRALRVKHSSAPEAELPAIKKEWDEQIAKADALLPELTRDALAAYEEAPNLDSTISRFLVKVLADDIGRDDYDAAGKLSDALIKNGSDFKQIYNYAGIVAFVNNDYENAEKYFKQAAEAKALDQVGQNFASILPEYRELWEKEKALREAEAKADDLPRVKIETSKGPIVVELFENEAPQTVGNFVSLVEAGKYDGTIFHRVLPGFMAQGGDPKGDGTGGPGYNIYCECYEKNRRDHFRGTLSMAHAGRDTGGSQFFLTFVPTLQLNGRHTVFGRIIEGMDVLAKIQRVDPSNPATAATPDKIIKATVERKRDHAYVPTKVE